jgi:mRNA interferase MazF
MLYDYLTSLLDWCKIKIFLATKTNSPLFKEGEVWWCRIGINVGVEIFGKGPQLLRPVLIFKKLNMNSFLAIPMTSQPKAGNWYIPVRYRRHVDRANIGQIRVLDGRRLLRRIASINPDNFQEVKTAFSRLYL